MEEDDDEDDEEPMRTTTTIVPPWQHDNSNRNAENIVNQFEIS
jgi:hypothetical protein